MTLPPELHAEAAREVRASWRHPHTGVVEANHKERSRHWQHWKEFAISHKTDPFFEGTPNQQKLILILTFAKQIRVGDYGKEKRVRAATVQLGLWVIGTTFELAGRPNPLYEDANRCKAPIRRMIEDMEQKDPVRR